MEEATNYEDTTVENNVEEKEGTYEGTEDQMEVDEGTEQGKVEKQGDKDEKLDDQDEEDAKEEVNDKTDVEAKEEVNGSRTVEEAKEQVNGSRTVEEAKEEVNGGTHEEATGVPVKDISKDGITKVEVGKNSNAELVGKVHATRSSKRVKDASSQLEASTVKESNQTDEDSQVDAPVSDPSVGNNGVKADQKVVAKDKQELKQADVPVLPDSSVGDGMETDTLCTRPSVPTPVKVKDEVKPLEDIKEIQMSSVDKAHLMQTSYFDLETSEGGEDGTEEEQLAFIKDVESVYKENGLEFKAPRFYGEQLNLLKLWRAVMKFGGYDKVTACKLWRQVGDSFKPPKTCTTVSWTFRHFYEKALLDYERYKANGGTLNVPAPPHVVPVSTEGQGGSNQTSGSGSGRMRRDAAARAMQGWHSQRLLGNGEVSDPIIKDKSAIPLKNREKPLKTIGLQKRKRSAVEEVPPKAAPHSKTIKIQTTKSTSVIDMGPPADWVKINVKTTEDCYEVYALVPGLLREEVRVQSDPAGRLVITGEPEQVDNPWGVTPFKKVVTLPSRIDPHQTSAVVTLHGQLFVRVPFEGQTD